MDKDTDIDTDREMDSDADKNMDRVTDSDTDLDRDTNTDTDEGMIRDRDMDMVISFLHESKIKPSTVCYSSPLHTMKSSDNHNLSVTREDGDLCYFFLRRASFTRIHIAHR
jgi:hypothetical protein